MVPGYRVIATLPAAASIIRQARGTEQESGGV